MTPSESHRSYLYSTLIMGVARPIHQDRFRCSECDKDRADCECFSLKGARK